MTLVLGCTPREHLRADWSRAVKARFAKQQVFLEPAMDTTQGLDSEEAAAIHSAYRKSLVPGAGESAEPQVLILETSKKKKK